MPPQTNNEQKQRRALLGREAYRSVQEMFKKEGVVIADDEIPTLTLHTPGKPPFPILILLLSVPKDIVDAFTLLTDGAAVTGIGLVLLVLGRVFATAFSALTALVLFLWILGKLNVAQKWGIRALVRKFATWAITRWAGATAAEFFVPLLPMATIFVLLAHHRENKYVAMLLTAAERMGNAFKQGKIKMKK